MKFILFVYFLLILVLAGINFKSFAQEPGMISIASKPSGALVIINGTETQKKTPFQQAYSPGSYEFKLIHENYQEYSGTFTITESNITVLNIELNPEFGILGIIAYPDAEIFVDGNRVGNRVYTGNISLGNHNVKITKEGYLTEEKEIILEKGSDINLNFELTRIPDVQISDEQIVNINENEEASQDKGKKVIFYIKPFAGLSVSHGFNSTNLQYSKTVNNYYTREIVGYGDSQFLGGAFGFWVNNLGFEFTYQHLVDDSWKTSSYENSSATSESQSNYGYYGFDTDIIGFFILIKYPKTPIYFRSGATYRFNPMIGYDYDYDYYNNQNGSNSEIRENWTYNLNNTFGYQGGLGLDLKIFNFLSLFVEGAYTISFAFNKDGYLNYGYQSNNDEYYNYSYNNIIVYKDFYSSPDYSGNYLDYPRESITKQYNLSSFSVMGGLTFKF